MQGFLPSDLAAFVDEEVASGRYPDADAVVATGLRILKQLEQRRAEVRAELQIGLDQLARGETIKLQADELRTFFDDIKARGRARLAASRARP